MIKSVQFISKNPTKAPRDKDLNQIEPNSIKKIQKLEDYLNPCRIISHRLHSNLKSMVREEDLFAEKNHRHHSCFVGVWVLDTDNGLSALGIQMGQLHHLL